jgi:hypothetical protein
MNFVSEKFALEVDKICMDERAAGCSPSCPGDKGASAEGVVDDTDEELPRPLTAGK